MTMHVSGQDESNNDGKWFFPVAAHGTKVGLNNAGVETFLDDTLYSLVRETIQNSLDAKAAGVDGPVRVEFTSFRRKSSEIPGAHSLREEFIPRAKATWKSHPRELAFVDTVGRVIDQSATVNILKVSDYNTTGLDSANWDSLVKETGTSEKSDTGAAGSKGIGKYAPFAASEPRMVVYNTKTRHYEQAIGIMQGISFFPDPSDENMVAQDRGFWGSRYNEPFDHQFSFHGDRNELGTDVFVVGLKRFDNIKERILLYVLENFLISIYDNRLEVVIEGLQINEQNLFSAIEDLDFSSAGVNQEEYERRLTHVKKYLEVLVEPDAVTIPLDMERFGQFSFVNSPDDATLRLRIVDQENATRRILQTRQSGMKIEEKSGFSRVYNFTGIWQAKARPLNTFLRPLENAEHNRWLPERADSEEEKKQAKKFLKELHKYIQDTIAELASDETESEIDAYGMAELLPDDLDDQQSIHDDANGISAAIKTVTVKPNPTPKRPTVRNPDVDDGFPGPGDEPGEDVPGIPGKPPRPGPPSPNPNRGTKSHTPTMHEITNVKVSARERDYRNGRYILIVMPETDMDEMRIKLAAAGESSDFRLNVELEDVDPDKYRVTDGDTIHVYEVKAGDRLSVNFKTGFDYRLKMKVTVYEYK